MKPKTIMEYARLADTKRFKEAAKIICSLSHEQAKFALLLANQRCRGYLMQPEKQMNFLDDLKRSRKARD